MYLRVGLVGHSVHPKSAWVVRLVRECDRNLVHGQLDVPALHVSLVHPQSFGRIPFVLEEGVGQPVSAPGRPALNVHGLDAATVPEPLGDLVLVHLKPQFLKLQMLCFRI